MHCIENNISTSNEGYMTSSNRVLIVDGMAVVNQVDFKPLKTYKDFALAFVNRLAHMVSDYTEVRLIFDRYLQQPLKASTRDRRTSHVHIRYAHICLLHMRI